jgi:hypothetical protein
VIYTGTHVEYEWIVSSAEIRAIPKIVVEQHQRLRLCITAFDGGVIRPGAEEIAIGWTMRNEVMVSPPLTQSVKIPHDLYDEWYVVSDPSFADDAFEVFVNYGAFTLVAPEVLCNTSDPTWEKHGFDFLLPIQERFWAQLQRINPTTYVAVGDNDVIVSRNSEFIRCVLDAGQKVH